LARRATKFAEGTLVKCKIAYGECAFFQQKKRVEKVILIGRHYCRPLEQTQYLVLDEADRMLDMGFAEEVMEIMEKGGIAGKEDLSIALATLVVWEFDVIHRLHDYEIILPLIRQLAKSPVDAHGGGHDGGEPRGDQRRRRRCKRDFDHDI
ncbi:hypothetical protein PRIPAC_98089, partial [Pristionchus pacificus]|uniref:Helicase n=1 Tax=Pristionchus pacificus TaxID=54126 RepID=A0A2A6BYT8_PRIPA